MRLSSVTLAIFFSTLTSATYAVTVSQSCSKSSREVCRNYFLSTARLVTTDVTSAIFSESNPVNDAFFGPLRDLVATHAENIPYAHPRIVVGPSQWEELITMYADDNNFARPGTWSYSFRTFTLNYGLSLFIDNLTSSYEELSFLYQSQPYNDTAEYQVYRNSLEPLAAILTMSNPGNADSFSLCSLWASVALKRERAGFSPFIPIETYKTCIRAAVTWSKIVLAHRTFYCNPECPKAFNRDTYAHIWDTDRIFMLEDNWMIAATGIAFTYDLLFDYIDDSDKVYVRSALALFVLDRFSWGSSPTSTLSSPNAEIHPHRIFSNWAAYHSNLYLANLAIEGEDGFDDYSISILEQSNRTTGFNQELHNRFSVLLEEFMKHSFYPDGSSFEDGYSYFIGMREGSLGLLASHRRGSNLLGTPRFRNIIHNAAQMFEPWQCGNLIGHASGGGNVYNAYAGLFHYIYPNGELPGMIWRQRFGDYKNNSPCRVFWTQSLLQLMFLGGEHSTAAESPGSLNAALRPHFKLSYYTPRRGLLIARSSMSEDSTYIHFDARPDAFFLGHDNADRGVFTFTVLRQTWLDDLYWKGNLDSRKHSLMHIDGLAQGIKAPAVKMIKVIDEGQVLVSAADLTYAYNVIWAKDHNHDFPPTKNIIVYDDTAGAVSEVSVTFYDPETADPWSLGWPKDDRAHDIGFRDDMTLFGEANIGFRGIWIWKRDYRENSLTYMVRSVGLVRSTSSGLGYGIIVDSVAAGPGVHTFDSYLILHPDVNVDTSVSHCIENKCNISLVSKTNAVVDVYVVSLGADLRYRVEVFDETKTRLICSSTREEEEEFWVVMHGREGDSRALLVFQNDDFSVRISYEEENILFRVNDTDHTLVRIEQNDEETVVEDTSETKDSTVADRETPAFEKAPVDEETTNPEDPPELEENPLAEETNKLEETPGAEETTEPQETPEDEESAVAVEPMGAIDLKRKTILKNAAMNPERLTFYDTVTQAPLQAVFNFTCKTNSFPKRRVQDRFMTCSKRTSVSVELSVYDCGDDGLDQVRYMNRKCILIDQSSAKHSCREYRTLFKTRLTIGKRYILVASISPFQKKPVLVLRHLTSPYEA